MDSLNIHLNFHHYHHFHRLNDDENHGNSLINDKETEIHESQSIFHQSHQFSMIKSSSPQIHQGFHDAFSQYDLNINMDSSI
jgi:hypothetical protein